MFSSLACSAVVFAAFVAYERPGLGIGHFYYLAIALAVLLGAWAALSSFYTVQPEERAVSDVVFESP